MAKKYDTYLWPGKLYGIFTAYLSSLTYYITQTLQKIRCVSGTTLCWGKPKGSGDHESSNRKEDEV